MWGSCNRARKLGYLTVPKYKSGVTVQDSKSENLLQMSDANSAGEIKIFSSYTETTYCVYKFV